MMIRKVHCFSLIVFILEFKAGKPERFHLGKPDFSKVVETAAYVDKSLFIKEFFQHNFSLITAPKMFGKSTNMDMLKKFLEIKVDESGNPYTNVDDGSTGIYIEKPQAELTENYKLFKKHNLKIYHERQFFYRHCGTHPVIFVSFKKVKGSDYEQVLRTSKVAIQNAFAEHQYLLKCKGLWQDSDKEIFTEYLKFSESEKKNELHVIFGLKFLSQILHKHFNKTVVLLIDDYDGPILEAIFNSNSEINKTVHFMRNFLYELVEGNLYIERGLFTGRLQLEGKGKLNNVEYFPFLNNHNFAEFHGLTSTELENLARNFDKFDKLNEIKDYYDGYNIFGKDKKIYNIWSILNYLKYCSVGSYWAEIGGIEEFYNMLPSVEIQSKIELLLNGDEIKVQKFRKLDVEQILIITRVVNQLYGFSHVADSDILLQFLFDNGYLKTTNIEPIKVKIPNIEIAKELADNLYSVSFFVKRFHLDRAKIREVNEAIKYLNYKNDSVTFKDFTTALADLFADPLVHLPNNDYDFHRALLTFAKKQGYFELVIGQNNFIKEKRLDIVVVRLDGSIVIMEVLYKVGSAYDGLKQILSRSYDDLLQKKYTSFNKRDVIYIGVHLRENRTTSISYLVNSLDIAGAINLTSSVV